MGAVVEGKSAGEATITCEDTVSGAVGELKIVARNGVDISKEYDTRDTDGDGLPDVWEKYGITYEGEFLDLPAMGADPNVPDVFVEVDYKSGINISEYDNEFKMVFNQFKKNNINLHIDRGSDSIDFVNGKKWGDNSKSNSISENVSISLSWDLFNPSNHFLNMNDKWKKLIKINFNHSPVRTVVFRYCILGDKIENQSSYAGYTVRQYFYIACESQKRDLLKSRDDYSKDRRLQYATVQAVMHELGHTLGLGHGGIKENGKPNNDARKREDYLSIMNYDYNYFGVYNKGTKYNLPWNEKGLTYSNEENDWGRLTYKIGEYGGALDGYINDFMDLEFIGDHDEIPIISSIEKKHTVAIEYSSDETGHWYACSGCDEKVDFEAHTEDSGAVTVEATETTEGVMTYSCSVCGYILKTETIPVIQPEHTHNYGTEWKSDSVSHWHECPCGDKTDIAQHISNGGTVTVQPTAYSTGLRTYSCTVCGYIIKTETVPATGNSGNDGGNSNSNSYNPSTTTPPYTPTTSTTTVTQPKLTLKATTKKDKITLKWNKIANAKNTPYINS